MLNKKLLKKLESIRDLPTIPLIMSQVLVAIDNPNTSAGQLANLIEKDQALTARVLRIANSPFYGFSKRISTIDLAVVILGMNSIKEMVLSLIVRKIVGRTRHPLFDTKAFWYYSVFCGTTSRLLARKLKYKLAGEAFVSGLMHDIGILIIAEFFKDSYKKIVELQIKSNLTQIQAEEAILEDTHCEIGAWIAEKWNLPENLVECIKHHHTHFTRFDLFTPKQDEFDFNEIHQPTTAVVSMAEWLSEILGLKSWSYEKRRSELYLSNEVFDDISDNEMLEPGSAFEIFKTEILEEYQKASILNDFTAVG